MYGFIIGFIGLGITEIAMGVHYKSQIECENNIMSVTHWLILNGTIILCITLLPVITNPICPMDGPTKLCIPTTFYGLLAGFKIAWMVIGSILFWGYCSDFSPKATNSIMKAELIMELIIFGILGVLHKRLEKAGDGY
jgi:hypothetical protein